jgi:hypothetical protein
MATATEVAKKAKVALMVTGSIFISGKLIRIDFQLHDVASAKLIYAGKVTGNEPFALADELGNQIRRKLEIDTGNKLTRNVADVTTCSIEAYQHYLEGVGHIQRHYYPEAESCFKKAITYDPEFACSAPHLASDFQESPRG